MPTSIDSTLGIQCSDKQLANGQCSFNVNQVIGRKTPADADATVLVQDIMLSATFFIGTVITIALMYSGWLLITAKDDSAASKGKNGIKWSLIGFALVISAYTIIRLVQYVAKG